MDRATSKCPGCGLERPPGAPPARSYYNVSPECWARFLEVMEHEYQDAVLFGRSHQLSVDAYAAQHAGGPHPDKSVAIHLCGLYWMLVEGVAPPAVAARLQALASRVSEWPRLAPPAPAATATVELVATASTPLEHAVRAREWAQAVWTSWSAEHATIAALAASTVASTRRKH